MPINYVASLVFFHPDYTQIFSGFRNLSNVNYGHKHLPNHTWSIFLCFCNKLIPQCDTISAQFCSLKRRKLMKMQMLLVLLLALTFPQKEKIFFISLSVSSLNINKKLQKFETSISEVNISFKDSNLRNFQDILLDQSVF